MTTPTLKPSQIKLIEQYTSLQFRAILFAGSVNTGKTYASAIIKVGVAVDFPNSRIGVFRKNLTTARKTVIPSYRKVLNDFGVKYRELGGSEPKFLLEDFGSSIEFFEMDQSKDQDWHKLRGLELTSAHIDEVDEVIESGVNVLMTRIGRWKDNSAPPILLMTCNPNNTWVRSKYYDAYKNNTLEKPYSMILAGKDEIPADYLKMLKETLPPKEFERYVENNWDFAEDENQLITYEMYRSSLWEPDDRPVNRLGVDVARLGNDKTIQSLFSNGHLMQFKESSKLEELQTAELVRNTILENKIDDRDVTIDVIGPGGGVVSALKTIYKIYPNEFNGGGTPTSQAEPLQFRNLRAEHFWKLRTGLLDGSIKLIEHDILKKELLNLRYFVKERYIQIENKEDMKKRLGFSPDHADSISMSLYKKGGANSLLEFYRNGTKEPNKQSFLDLIKTANRTTL